MQFHIPNMECGGCARGVTKALQTVDPTVTVETDLDARKVTVASNQPESAFLPALAAAGFPAAVLQGGA